MEITAANLVADIAAHHPRSIEVFERHGIDFCCGGRRALGRGLRVLDLGCGAARNAAPTAAEELVAELLLAGFEKTRWNASGTAGPTRRSTRPSYQGVKP